MPLSTITLSATQGSLRQAELALACQSAQEVRSTKHGDRALPTDLRGGKAKQGEAGPAATHLDPPAVQDEPCTLVDSALHKPLDACQAFAADHRAHVCAFLHTRIHPQGPGSLSQHWLPAAGSATLALRTLFPPAGILQEGRLQPGSKRLLQDRGWVRTRALSLPQRQPC